MSVCKCEVPVIEHEVHKGWYPGEEHIGNRICLNCGMALGHPKTPGAHETVERPDPIISRRNKLKKQIRSLRDSIKSKQKEIRLYELEFARSDEDSWRYRYYPRRLAHMKIYLKRDEEKLEKLQEEFDELKDVA